MLKKVLVLLVAGSLMVSGASLQAKPTEDQGQGRRMEGRHHNGRGRAGAVCERGCKERCPQPKCRVSCPPQTFKVESNQPICTTEDVQGTEEYVEKVCKTVTETVEVPVEEWVVKTRPVCHKERRIQLVPKECTATVNVRCDDEKPKCKPKCNPCGEGRRSHHRSRNMAAPAA
jgi:hypothetical protein